MSLPGVSDAARGQHVEQHDRDDRADDGHDDRVDIHHVPAARGALAEAEQVGQETADERAHDAEHDVANNTPSLVTANEQSGDVAGDGAQDYPGNDRYKHLNYLPMPRATSRSGGLCDEDGRAPIRRSGARVAIR